MTDQEIIGALRGIDENNLQWRALLEILRRQTRIELESLLVPNLTDSAAQYNRGRVAALETVRDVLEQAWRVSRVPG